MQKKVSVWDENRLSKAVDIFIEKKGEAFSFLEKFIEMIEIL